MLGSPASAAARVAMIALAMAAGAGAAPAPPGAQAVTNLVAQWPMEADGDAVPDVSGNGHDGGPTGTAEFAGRFGKAMSFLDLASSRVTVRSAGRSVFARSPTSARAPRRLRGSARRPRRIRGSPS